MIQTIGILGGGQLGRMMCMAAKSMGYTVVVLDPEANCPAGQVADEIIIENYDNINACQLLYNICDVVTYEFENIPLQTAFFFENKLPQTSRLLQITQDRILEKQIIQSFGLKTAPYCVILESNDMLLFAKRFYNSPNKIFIKTVRGGYDGKGQFVIENIDEFDNFLNYVYQTNYSYVIEDAVDFTHELSVIVCRNINGEKKVFPVTENIHRNQVLYKSIAPARIDESLSNQIESLALKFAEDLKLVGTLSIELFLCGNEIIVNELAPRPHNSGHYTLNACLTSQFEQHVRAICALPLGDVNQIMPCVMLNVFGEDMHFLNRTKISKHKLYLYGKSESRLGRKMGHINILDNNIESCLQIADKIL